MPANQFVSQAAFLKLYWNTGSQLSMNVIGCLVTGNPVFNQALADGLGASVKTAFTTHLGTLFAASASLVRVGIRDYRAPNLPEFRDAGAPVAGSAVGDMLPASVALCVTLRTAKAGKSFRGRTYLSGWAETQNAATGIGVAGAATGATNFVSAIQTALTGNGMQLGVISRPALRQTIVRTTFETDGSSSAEVLSETTAKTGQVTAVTIIESRNLQWEQQRRRANSRGALPTSLDSVASVVIAP